MEFDFCDHQLRIRESSGAQRSVVLAPKPVAQFYLETAAALRELDLDVSIRTTPTEVERAIPFQDDDEHASYDPAPRTCSGARTKIISLAQRFTDTRYGLPNR